jgi:hypothetical protein
VLDGWDIGYWVLGIGYWVCAVKGRKKADAFRKLGVTKVFGGKGEKVTGNCVVRSFMVFGPRKILSV